MKRQRQVTKTVMILLCSILVTACLLGGLTARRKVSSSDTDGASVAVMAADVTAELQMDGYPGKEKVYPITLTNKEGNSVCEVKQQYTLSVEQGSRNLPLEANLYRDQSCRELITEEETGTFEAGEEESRTYYLKVSWPEEENAASLAFEIDYFTVSVHAVQID